MVIIVTDEGRFWNHKNPALEPYAPCVLVVCLSGVAVTDKYRCFLSPYQEPTNVMGRIGESVNGQKYHALLSAADQLCKACGYHEDILFLTDDSPQSLFAYLVLREKAEYNRLHLWCMTPTGFAGQESFDLFFSHFVYLTSLLYLDATDLCRLPRSGDHICDVLSAAELFCNQILPSVICDIDTKMDGSSKYFFDFRSRRYIKTDSPFDKMLAAKPISEEELQSCRPYLHLLTLGLLVFDEPEEANKHAAEQLQPRFNGKKICEQLKKMRRALIEANGLDYRIADCPLTGPCAGTCPQCDLEITEIQCLLLQIPQNRRIYPTVSMQELRSINPLPDWSDLRCVLRKETPHE